MVGSLLFGVGCFMAGWLFGPLIMKLIAKKVE